MSSQEVHTGDVVELDRAAAERRAGWIRSRLDSIADDYAAVMPMIREAIEKRDDLALGYRSVSEYVSDRFGGALTRLGVEVRREVVRELTEAGMSSRSIAPIVGVSDRMVRKDQSAGGNQVPTSQAPESSASVAEPKAAPAEREQAPAPDPAGPRPAAKPVTGIDGKTYPRRDPLTGRGEVGPGGGPRPGRTTTEPVQSPGPLVRAVRRAVDDLAAAPAQDLEQLEPWHRKEARVALEQLAAVLDRVDPQIDPDLDAAADDIVARTHVDVDEARWIARAVRDRNKPGSLLNYVRRIDPTDLLARYRPERRQSAAAMPPCEHGISGGLRVIGRGAQASRHCSQCETADPAVREEATP